MLGAGDFSWLSLHYSFVPIMQNLRITVHTSSTKQSMFVSWFYWAFAIPYCQYCVMASSLPPMKRSFRQRLIDNWRSFDMLKKTSQNWQLPRLVAENFKKEKWSEFLLVVVVFKTWRWLKLSTYMRLWAGRRKLGLNQSMWLRHWLQEYTMFGSCSVEGDIMWTSFRQVYYHEWIEKSWKYNDS